MINYKSISALVLVSLLAACGGESVDTSSPSSDKKEPPILQASAIDGFSVVKPNVASYVDLSAFVREEGVDVTSVRNLDNSEQCGIASVNGTGFDITSSGEGTYCRYEYSVRSKVSLDSTATLNVLASTADAPMLPPLSESMLVEGDQESFNLAILLGSDWKETYSLQGNSLSVQGMEGNLGSATASGNVISYTPPSLSGWNRIVYTVLDSADPTATKLGVIYITISESANSAPIIGKPKYDYNVENPSLRVLAGQRITLDLSSLANLRIREPEDQDWQLVSAQSFSATVQAVDPTSVVNKSLYFTAATIGKHIISYIVGDHYGGYSSGLIQVEVLPNESVVTWTDLVAGGNTYSAPILYSQAVAKGIYVKPAWDRGVSNTLAGFNSESGNLYCGSTGSIPTVAQLRTLRSSYLSDGNLVNGLDDWPQELPYLGYSGTSFVGYYMSSGTWLSYDADTLYNATCVKNEFMSLQMLATSLVADNTVAPIAQVTMPLPTDDFRIEKVAGSLNDGDVNIRKYYKIGNVTTLATSSSVTGTYAFKVVDLKTGDSLTSGVLTYVADSSSAQFNGSPQTWVSNRIASSGEYLARLRITDARGNPIANQAITANVSGDSQLATRGATTDKDGYATVSVYATVPFSKRFSASASFTRADGAVQSIDLGSSWFLGGAYPCSVGYNSSYSSAYGCLPVTSIPFAGGRLFASPPPPVDVANSFGFYPARTEYVGPLHVPVVTRAQGIEWCSKLKGSAYGGRNLWTLADINRAQALLRNRHYVSSWPTTREYITNTGDGQGNYWVVNLATGTSRVVKDTQDYYPLCSSDFPI